MQRAKSILLIILFLFRLNYVLASSNATSTLEERGYFTDRSCQRLIPFDYSARRYRDRLKSAFRDIILITRRVAEGNNWDRFVHSTAFSHYFLPEDAAQVRLVYRIINQNILPFTSSSHFMYKCGDDQALPGLCDGNTLAITNTSSASAEIVFCEMFFTKRGSELFLNSFTLDLGTFPFDDSERGWCRVVGNYDQIQVGAALVLHEMTHLDVVGRLAGLPERQISRYSYR